jgi:hypothetical protein
MRISTAYFAGVGTVVVAIAAGLGGGLLFANIVNPHSAKYGTETSKLEQRMSQRAVPVISSPSEPVPYLAAATTATNPVTVAAAPVQTAPQTQPAEPLAVDNAAPPQPASAAVPSSAPAEQAASQEPVAAPREAFAKARDADVKRAATEKQRAERRQRWAEKRRYRQPREQELDAVEEKVREETEPRQALVAEPAKLDVPRIKLFDPE